VKKYLIGVLVLAGAGGGALFWRGQAAAAAKPAGLAVTATSERRTLEVVVEAAGLVEPTRVIEVKSKASGEVLKVPVDTGDVVQKGTLLAEIDPRDVQSALEQAQADLESALVKAQVTEAHRSRMKELLGTRTATQEEYESAVDQAASAKAQVVRTKTALRLATERRGDVTIRAPGAGTVLSRSAEAGQIIASATSNVSGGTALFTMADLSQMQVRAKVSEADIGRIVPGQKVRISVEAYPDRSFPGEVVKVEPGAVVEQNVTLFPVLVRADNRAGLLRPGMNAEVQVEIASRADAVAVPSGAVVSLRDAVSAAKAVGVSEAAVRAAFPKSGGGERGSAGGVAAGERSNKAGASGGGSGGDAAVGGANGARGKSDDARGGGSTGGSAAAGVAVAEGGPGVLFVSSAGTTEARAVTLGLSDWEYTEVKAGLQAGEQVVLVSVAQLQKAQADSAQKMRDRAGGVVPGAAAPGASGGGRR
jgi:HlyD family secretion protein